MSRLLACRRVTGLQRARRCRRACCRRPREPADRALGRVAVATRAPDRVHAIRQLRVARAAAQQRAQVMSAACEQACEELAVSRQPSAIAAGTERSADGVDQADLTGPVDVAVARGDLAVASGRERFERPARGDPSDDLGGRHDLRARPAVGRADVHVLDETQRLRAAAEVLGHRRHAALVEAASHDHVDLHGIEPGRDGRVDALEHARRRDRRVADRLERLVVERVEADRDAAEAGVGERPGLAREQQAVGGQRNVVDSVDPGKHRDKPLEVAAQQRLAAGQPQLVDSLRRQHARQPRDLLEAQQLAAGQEHMARAVDLTRHAVAAAQVAAICHRDAQVTQRPIEQVEHAPGSTR